MKDNNGRRKLLFPLSLAQEVGAKNVAFGAIVAVSFADTKL